MTLLDLDDIQGLVLRGYPKDFASHLVLRIDDPDAFRRVLEGLTEENRESPYVTVATDWARKPPEDEPATRCVNIAFTCHGLERLGVDEPSLATFPTAFLESAAARAAKHAGETGPNHPDEWRATCLKSDQAHVILSVYADSEDERDRVIAETRVSSLAATTLGRYDAHRLDGRDVEHFGYVDGISQPTIEGNAPLTYPRDPLPPVKAGNFVLGHEAERPIRVPIRPNSVSTEASPRSGSCIRTCRRSSSSSPPNRAGSASTGSCWRAKLCGRWRNGEPLVMRPPGRPGEDRPGREPQRLRLRDDSAFPQSDRDGLLCPRGAHIRRACHPQPAGRRRLRRDPAPHRPPRHAVRPEVRAR